MPTKTWVVGEEVLAADFNAMVQRQVVATFPNAAGRTAGISAPTAGMLTYLTDVNAFETWNGAAWVPLAGPGRGQLAYKIKGANQTGITTTAVDITDLTATITTPQARTIEIAVEMTAFKAPADATSEVALRITNGAGVTQVERVQTVQISSQYTMTAVARLISPTGSQTWKVMMLTSASFVNVAAGARFWIDDIGPAGMPA